MPHKTEQNMQIINTDLTKNLDDKSYKMHKKYMKAALKQAEKAENIDEVPVGAVVVRDGHIIARAHNLRESKADPTAHAEIVAIRKAAKKIGNWRLDGCTLYITLEPCPMCAGAIINARVPSVVFGASDPKAGAFGTMYDLNEGRLNHTCRVISGIMSEECSKILSEYFSKKRSAAKKASAIKKQRCE